MDIINAGEDALIVYLGKEPSPEVAAAVQAATQAIRTALGDNLVDVVPSYASVLVVFNLLRCDHLAVRNALQKALGDLRDGPSQDSRLVTLPVYYDPEVGPDLEALACRADMSIDAVIDCHSRTEYRVYAIGFAPGFAYLGQVDERIAAPRLDTPRQSVPKGSVAIADRQTAVYPAASPGGWNLIGRCPTQMFDPLATPTMPVQVGDRVHFHPIDRSEFLELGGSL